MSARTGLTPGAADCDRPRSGCREVARTPKPAAWRWRTMHRPRNPVPPNTVTDCAAIVRLAYHTQVRPEPLTRLNASRYSAATASPQQSRHGEPSPGDRKPRSPFRGSKRRAFRKVMHDTPTLGDLPVVVLCFKGSPALSTARVAICCHTDALAP